MTEQPVGPTTRRLLEELERVADKIDAGKASVRLRDLGEALIKAADSLDNKDPRAFKHINADHLRTVHTLIAAFLVSQDLTRVARALDAEDN